MHPMGRVEINIPLVTWRDGRPRFFASPAQRQLGFKGQDLRHPNGDWFTLEEAIAWSSAKQAEIRDRRDGAPLAPAPRKAPLLTVSQLVEAFLDQPRMKGEEVVRGKRRRRALKPNTVRYYRMAARALERHNNGRVWLHPASGLTAAALGGERGILARIEEESGLAVARAVRATLSAAYGFGRGRLVQVNPFDGLDALPGLGARLRCGEPAEMAAFIKGADALGFADLADAVLLGLMTGQRQNDRLALTAYQMTDDGILFRQSKKHGQPLLIPMLDPELLARLAAAKARRAEWRVNYPHVLLDERQRRPWEADWYRKVFRVVKLAIATGELETGRDGKPTVEAQRLLGDVDIRARLAAAGLAPCASLADFRDQDLRDTAVTWLARAGCSKFEIASITGHSLKSIDEILKHYLGLHPDLARSAMGKLLRWREGKGL